MAERVFPEPDPMLRFVDPESIPYAFWSLTGQDRGRRIRLFLISQCAQGPEYPLVDWAIALDMTPEGEAYARDVVDKHDDAAIEEAIARERAKWSRFYASLAAGG